jgi:hypothetical protein
MYYSYQFQVLLNFTVYLPLEYVFLHTLNMPSHSPLILQESSWLISWEMPLYLMNDTLLAAFKILCLWLLTIWLWCNLLMPSYLIYWRLLRLGGYVWSYPFIDFENFVSLTFLAVIKFELRALLLLSQHFTTLATQPTFLL